VILGEEMIAAQMALYAAAERHDWRELARHIASGGEITPEIRKFIVAVLRGEVTRPKKRPPSSAAVDRHLTVATFVFLARRFGIKNATQKAAQKYYLDHRSVQRILKGVAASSVKKVIESLEQQITRRSTKEEAEELLAAVAALAYGINTKSH
jgi:hypothetical protein